jgi:hypothetical protein
MHLRKPIAVAAVCATACSSATPAGPTTPATAAKVDPTYSDPAEYQVSHISEDAGEAIFARTGVATRTRPGCRTRSFSRS